ncbi:hypothetical protein BTVI_85346 [Pitangus sulphuratus]|nr:hypothetical protein BTVI_85346 [Pitangus sulphuratus]
MVDFGKVNTSELLQLWDHQHREHMELWEPEMSRGEIQDDQRDGAGLLGEKDGRTEIVQPGQEKLWGDLTVASQCLKELQEGWRETIYREWSDRTRGNGFN